MKKQKEVAKLKKSDKGATPLDKARAAKKNSKDSAPKLSKKVNTRLTKDLGADETNTAIIIPRGVTEVVGDLIEITATHVIINHKKYGSKLRVLRTVYMKDILAVEKVKGAETRIVYMAGSTILAAAGKSEFNAKLGIYQITTATGTVYVNQNNEYVALDTHAALSESAPKKKKKKVSK